MKKICNDCGYKTPFKKNLNNHVEKVHKKKKIEKQICCPFCALMQLLIWNEVFVWISARLRFHKKIFWIDIESEISKVKINFSVKSVRVLKCLHNFITRQQIWWSDTSEKLGTTNVFWNFYSVWSFSTGYFTFLLVKVL